MVVLQTNPNYDAIKQFKKKRKASNQPTLLGKW